MDEIHSPEKERQILAGAAHVFAQDGYEGASMSRIAQQAGVSKGTLYNYFESKAELFIAYVKQQCGGKLTALFEMVDGNDDPAEALRGIGRRMLRLLFSPEALTIHRVVMSEAGKFPQLAQAFYEAGPAVAIRHLAEWLAAQTRIGRLRVPDPEFAAEQFFALCRTRYGMKRELRLLSELPACGAEKVVESAVSMFLRSYGP